MRLHVWILLQYCIMNLSSLLEVKFLSSCSIRMKMKVHEHTVHSAIVLYFQMF